MPKHATVNRWEIYQEENPDFCPRCKQGILADHGNRKSCGKCGYSEIQKRSQPQASQQEETTEEEEREEASEESDAEEREASEESEVEEGEEDEAEDEDG